MIGIIPLWLPLIAFGRLEANAIKGICVIIFGVSDCMKTRHMQYPFEDGNLLDL